MTRTPRWAAAAAPALALTACGGGQTDDPTVAAPAASDVAPAADCPTETTTVPAPASVSKDLEVQPKVPANTGTPPTAVTVADALEAAVLDRTRPRRAFKRLLTPQLSRLLGAPAETPAPSDAPETSA